mmetsp:Transcript_22345/g.44750  ORF Transcript_22345/g.44750 Transcript_22345/m.44750 type:complete len:398 (-) Transcript_22345:262-1455(-)
MVTKEFGEFGTVGRIFVDAQFEVLRERLVEFVVGVFIFSEVVKHFDALLDQILLDDTKNLVLLKGFTRNVERKILRIDNSLDEGQPLGHQILAVVHDEYATDIQLNVVVLLLGSSLKHVEGGTFGAEENGLELELPLDGEVFDGGVLFPVIGDGLVKGGVLVLGDVVGFSHPEGLHVVEVLPFVGNFLDLLCFLLLLGVFLIDFLDLGLVVIALLLLVIIVIRNLLLGSLLSVEFNGEPNELRVLFHQILQAPLLEVLAHILLQVQHNPSPTSQSRVLHLRHSETSPGLGTPRVAVVLVVLGSDLHFISHQVCRIKSHSELSNHGNVRSGRESLHEGLGPGLGDGSKIIDEVGLGHADAAVFDGQSVVGLVGDELDLQFWLGVQDGGVGETLVADLV